MEGSGPGKSGKVIPFSKRFKSYLNRNEVIFEAMGVREMTEERVWSKKS